MTSTSIDYTSLSLELFEALCDADADEVNRVLAEQPLRVAAQVRRLLAADREGDDLGPDEVAVALAVALGPDAQSEPDAPAGFELLDCIGRGGMGRVYRAWQLEPRRLVALKFVLDEALPEAQALADTEHPCIPTVYAVGRQERGAWLAMELIDGERLGEWMRGASEAERLRAMAALCRGVQHAHDRGVVHRDLKPDNVLVDARGPRLVDFGLATSTTGDGEPIAGTLAFTADEVLDGEPADARSDVFSLGLLLRVVAHGTRRAGYPASLTVAEQRRLRREPLDLRRDDPVDCIVARAIAPREQRYATADALADEIERVLAGRAPHAQEASLALRSWLLLRRHQRAVVLAGALVTLLGIVLAPTVRATWAEQRRERQAATRWEQFVVTGAADDRRELDSFIAQGAYQGTRARREALLRRADQLWRAGDGAGARLDLAEVLGHVDDAETRSWAALRLAELFEAERAWRSLDALWPLLPTGPARDRAQERASIGLRQWSDVRAEHPLFAHWSQARVVDMQPTLVAEVWQDGRRELVVAEPEARRLSWLAPTPALTRLDQRPYPQHWSRRRHDVRLAGEGRFLVVPHEVGHRVDVVPGHAVERPLASPDLPGRMWSAAALDWVRTDAPTLFIGTASDHRGLSRLTWPYQHAVVADEGIERTASDPSQLIPADLNGDGKQELVVHLGPWSAHDVRVYVPDKDGGMELRGREQLGGVGRMALLPVASGETLVAMVKTDGYANPRLFGPDAPHGEPAGLYLYRYDGEELQRVASYPIDDLEVRHVGVFATDLDGDGDRDILAFGTDQTQVLQLDPTGALEDVYGIADMHVVGVANIDDDVADEVFATFAEDPQRMWVLGVGDDAPPALAASDEVDVSELERLGLYDAAARQLASRAEVAPTPAQAAQHWERVALLRHRSGVRGADRAALRHALSSEETPERWQLLARWLAEEAEYGAMRDVPEAYRLGEPASWRDPVVFDLAQDLPTAEWLAPQALQWRPGEGLLLRGAPGDDVVFRLPLRRVADAVSLAVDLDVLSAEGGGNIEVSLRDADERLLGVIITPWGGSRLLQRKSRCSIAAVDQDLALEAPSEGMVDVVTQHRMRVAWADGSLVCTLERDGVQRVIHRDEDLDLPRDVWLDVRFPVGLFGSPAARIRALLRRIEIGGVEQVPVADNALATAWVRGRADQALALVGHDVVADVDLLTDAGLFREAVARWRRREEEPSEARVVASMRRHPMLWLGLLGVGTPDVDAERFASGFSVAYSSGEGLATERLQLVVSLDSLPIASPAVASFLLDHAQSLSRHEQSLRARRVLERIVASDAPDGVRSQAALALVRVLVQLDEAEAARAACNSARQLERIPFWVDDHIRREAVLQGACQPP